MTAEERRGELIEIWTKATNEVAKEMETALPQENPLWKMINSGARGNLLQLRQIAAIRGLVANPKGEIIPRPIKASYREGLSVLEYFISTHGARKGLADTALRTADSGYLTRRLVDVSQDVIIREEDCGTDRAIPMQVGERLEGGKLVVHEHAETSVHARTLADDIKGPDGTVVADAGSGPQLDPGRQDRRRRGRDGPGAQRADLRVEAGRLRGLLRPLAADRQDRGRRRGGRHHRRPVDR